MSTETRSELLVIPAQVKVKKHVRYVYSCRYCEQHEIETPIVTAKMPEPVFPKSLASPSAMAYTMTQKYGRGSHYNRRGSHWEELASTIPDKHLPTGISTGRLLCLV